MARLIGQRSAQVALNVIDLIGLGTYTAESIRQGEVAS